MERGDLPTDSFTGDRAAEQPTRGAVKNQPYSDGDEHQDIDDLLPSLESGITLLDIEGGRGVPVLHSLVLDHLLMNEGDDSVPLSTVWLFTGERAVSDAYVNRVRWLARAMIVAFVGLIVSFGIAGSQGGDTLYLLVAFAPLAVLTIWAAAVFFLHQLTRLPVVTTDHLLTAAGFLVLGVAVTFGALMAIAPAGVVGMPSFAPEGHVFGIFAYLLLMTTGIMEWLVVRERGRWTHIGALQVGFGVLLGLWLPLLLVPLVAGVPQGPLTVVLLLGYTALIFLVALCFLGRVGVWALRTNPLTPGVDAWVFFATLWFVVVIFSYPRDLVLGGSYGLGIFSIHAAFVGVVTNMLFGVVSARTRFDGVADTWAEPAAMWLMNAGVVVFVGLLVATGSAHGALVMGTGVLLGAGWALISLREITPETGTTAEGGIETTD